MIEMTEFVIKTIAVPDVAVLDEFLYHAVFIPPNEKPIAREIIYTPEIYVYAEEFGKPDDIFVAAIVGEKTVGAAWSRILCCRGKKGFGNVDEYTPELAISVLPDYRNNGIGTALLSHLIAELLKRNYKGFSLSVQKENPALHLYERAGFGIIRENKDDYIMLLHF